MSDFNNATLMITGGTGSFWFYRSEALPGL